MKVTKLLLALCMWLGTILNPFTTLLSSRLILHEIHRHNYSN